MSETVIEAYSLRKQYGKFVAVKDIDFAVKRSQCFGFLGPNGAGKTTTMRMIYLAAKISAGTLKVFGQDLSQKFSPYVIKNKIGVIPQEENLDHQLTVQETLEVFCRFYGLLGEKGRQRARELLKYVRLLDKAESKVLKLSGGMKRRLQVARGLIGNPELLILDEPTTGLDPQVRNELWDHLKDLKLKNVTLLLTTHYMHEAEQLCDDLVIMDHGEIIARGHPRKLIKENVPRHVVEVLFDQFTNSHSPWLLQLKDKVNYTQQLTDRILLYTDDSEALLGHIHSHGQEISAFIRHATLEDVFLKVTGRKLAA